MEHPSGQKSDSTPVEPDITNQRSTQMTHEPTLNIERSPSVRTGLSYIGNETVESSTDTTEKTATIGKARKIHSPSVGTGLEYIGIEKVESNTDTTATMGKERKSQSSSFAINKLDTDTTAAETARLATSASGLSTAYASTGRSRNVSKRMNESQTKSSQFFTTSPGRANTMSAVSNTQKSTAYTGHLDEKTGHSVEQTTGPSGRRLFVVRHGERLDRIFPGWLRLAFPSGTYKPYDLNQPIKLPKRNNTPADFENDSPITEIGQITSQIIGRAMKMSHNEPMVVYCSPALHCVQTAHNLLKTAGSTCTRIRIEPALFEWMRWYETPPNWMTPKQLQMAGYPIDCCYKPIKDIEALLKCNKESSFDHYNRTFNAIESLLKQNRRPGLILIVAHATTLDATIRPLLGHGTEKLTRTEMDRTGLQYPYGCCVAVEELRTGKWQMIINALSPITHIDFSSRVNYQYLHRQDPTHVKHLFQPTPPQLSDIKTACALGRPKERSLEKTHEVGTAQTKSRTANTTIPDIQTGVPKESKGVRHMGREGSVVSSQYIYLPNEQSAQLEKSKIKTDQTEQETSGCETGTNSESTARNRSYVSSVYLPSTKTAKELMETGPSYGKEPQGTILTDTHIQEEENFIEI